MEKRLYKIEEGKKIDGVCGGIAEYLNIDPTIVRLIWTLFALMYGIGIIMYIVAMFVMPKKSEVLKTTPPKNEDKVVKEADTVKEKSNEEETTIEVVKEKKETSIKKE